MGYSYQADKSKLHWMTPDRFTETRQPKQEKIARARVLSQGCYNPKTYEYDDSFKPYDPDNPLTVHNSFEMAEYLSKHPEAELDARVLGWEDGNWKTKSINRAQFLESFCNKDWDNVRFRENFGSGGASVLASPTGISNSAEFTPLLGGPFYKNLYYYTDYIRMHSEAFAFKNRNPVANAVSAITRDFVMGSDFEVQCDTTKTLGQIAMAAWKAYEEVNDLHAQIDHACEELSIFGEIMWWKLPYNQTKIIFQLSPGDTVPYGAIPRVRLLDPSNLVEIVTYPEDISRVLFYCWLTPTQWQMFQTGVGEGRPKDMKHIQPSLKFIYRTIMADQILHYRINTVTGEKRGRTDYFPILSYLKRLDDTVDFSLVALQKISAWAMDTEIDGDQSDIDAYVQAQASLGTIAPAGSEFVHTTKIKRTMQANEGSSNINSDAFALGLSMCAMGTRIPVSWFGTHLSGGQTKASALVSTEPVVKKMEKRRGIMKRMIRDHWDYCMQASGLPKIDCDIIFPELVTQDRSQKLKDLALAEDRKWIAPDTAAAVAAKELQIQHYHYQTEIQKMKQEIPEIPQGGPLTTPGEMAPPSGEKETDVRGVTSVDKRQEKKNDLSF